MDANKEKTFAPIRVICGQIFIPRSSALSADKFFLILVNSKLIYFFRKLVVSAKKRHNSRFMNEKELQTEEPAERNPLELVLEDFKFHLVSSAEMHKGEPRVLPENELKFATENEAAADEPSEIFKELMEPKLPALPAENRARLQMQSPNRIYFYWSVRQNPFQILQKMFGARAADYTLVAKLINQTDGGEVLYPVGPFGSTWFDVESDATYRVEVGFYAANRPFIRLIFSNAVETPRSAPSPYFDLSPQFAVSRSEFVEVLDASGYRQDAFELALAGDDEKNADTATQNALFALTGERNLRAKSNELRYVLFALAAGAVLEDLRGMISPELFAFIESLMTENAEKLSREKVLAALQENFDFEDFEETEEEESEVTYKTFGASLVNFQKFPRKRRLPRKLGKPFPKFAPVSSLR
jgi:hypothetical protein